MFVHNVFSLKDKFLCILLAGMMKKHLTQSTGVIKTSTTATIFSKSHIDKAYLFICLTDVVEIYICGTYINNNRKCKKIFCFDLCYLMH